MRRYLVVLILAVAIALPATPAAAGGWWSGTGLVRRHVAIGATLTIRSDALFKTVAEVEAARDGVYAAYLVRGYDRTLLRKAMRTGEPREWWALNDRATVVRVGAIEVVSASANLVSTKTTITIPRVAPGRYNLMYCDAGCVNPMADTIPSRLRVSADPVAVNAAAGVDRLQRRLTILRHRLFEERRADASRRLRLRSAVVALRDRVDAAEGRTGAAEAEAAALQGQVDTLANRVAALESEPPAAVPPWAVAGLVLLALGGAALLVRRRRGDAVDQSAQGDDADHGEWERPLAGSRRA